MTTDRNKITLDIDLSQLFYGEELKGDEAFPLPLLNGLVKEIAANYMREVGADLRREAVELVRAAIKEQSSTLVEQVMGQVFQPTDYYGNPKGEPRAIRYVVVEEAVKYLTKKDSGMNGGKTVVEKFLADEVQRAFNSELKSAVSAAKQQVLDAVQAEGAKVLSQTIANMAGIR